MAEGTVSDFSAFFALAEPRLRRAFVSAYGGERGREATAEALAWGWEHWSEVEAMDNPIGYLYRVGRSRTRGRRFRVMFERSDQAEPWVEPRLGDALAALTERQRVAVALVHGYGWTLREVADVCGLRVTTIQNHLERGTERLRSLLGVPEDV
ncbi:MAG TPA: sigma-70 family RNA polymerase sigma factor [Acidimicrobiia bacterium]|nr:sigma-70 family RNA polymerase sigma factor [Acidimicrobiia bacterium]